MVTVSHPEFVKPGIIRDHNEKFNAGISYLDVKYDKEEPVLFRSKGFDFSVACKCDS
jgi:hypothetical protein